MIRRGLVLGCGGTVGGAWQVGALAAVERHLGWDARTADVIVGTSAGASTAMMLGSGVGVDELVAAHHGDATARDSVREFLTSPPEALPSPPFGAPAPGLVAAGLRRRAALTATAGLLPVGRTDASFLTDLADDLVSDRDGWVDHPATWIVATELDSGDRVVFGHPTEPATPIRDAVRASWAIPGWYPPVAIRGRRHVDGGVVSTASADILAGSGVTEAIVITPMASPRGIRGPGLGGRLEQMLRAPMSRVLDAELMALQSAGVTVVRIQPTAVELARMGWNYMKPEHRLAALAAAAEGVPATLAASY